MPAPQDGGGLVGNGNWSGALKRSALHRDLSINRIEELLPLSIVLEPSLDHYRLYP
ncbi:hypothetical protein [Rhizobium yanglingense]